MFATNAVSSILGVGPDQLQGKSLYECIADNCWGDAIKCLESAKANDSIVYLRFWSRDPRVEGASDGDESNVENQASENDSEGGVRLSNTSDVSMNNEPGVFIKKEADTGPQINQPMTVEKSSAPCRLYTSLAGQTQTANIRGSQRPMVLRGAQPHHREPIPTCELEAVVSCTSDGLLMVLRKARPPIPSNYPPRLPAGSENGLFASPWNEHSIHPNYPPELLYTFNHFFCPSTRLHEAVSRQLGVHRVTN
ncbi:hypothetical protein NUW58_g4895 [Xylaria curta]|uniref:Uncharacterized protein n=1 Tax=Xylaria curta TaxID=42375 RepID=A0ACC1P4B7_9PEZI|nr:hypothetical protein NUW58_g4895 [Xylaria curta]